MLDIVKYPDKILRKKVKKVLNITSDKIQNLIAEMKETMVKADGIGLAANQINKNLRILVVNTKDGAKAFINPFIYWKSFKKCLGEEGCLSFPGIFGIIRRPERTRLFYRDEQGKLRHLAGDGLIARVLQHEIDHLNGILYIDKIIEYTAGEAKAKNLIQEAKADEK